MLNIIQVHVTTLIVSPYHYSYWNIFFRLFKGLGLWSCESAGFFYFDIEIDSEKTIIHKSVGTKMGNKSKYNSGGNYREEEYS